MKVILVTLFVVVMGIAGAMCWHSCAQQPSKEDLAELIVEPEIEVRRFACRVSSREGSQDILLMTVHVRHLQDEPLEGLRMGGSFWTTGKQRIGFATSGIDTVFPERPSGWFEIIGAFNHPLFESCTIDWIENQDGRRLTWRPFEEPQW